MKNIKNTLVIVSTPKSQKTWVEKFLERDDCMDTFVSEPGWKMVHGDLEKFKMECEGK